MELSREQKNILLKLARESIESNLFNKKKTLKINFDENPVFKSKSGVFVTLTIASQLRGCIGYITATTPLFQTIQDAAASAAFNDPRFNPLTEKEYDQIELEISVLSEPFQMKSYDEIEVGKHGLILEEAGRRGLLLPQVPIEHRLNREQFLDAICRKAGVSPNLWRGRKLDISLFTATVFNEKDLDLENGTN